MINLYVYNEEKKILGFTFYLFGHQEYVVDYDKYPDVVDMNRYFEGAKGDIVGINLEKFISFCNSNAKGRTVLIDEAISDLKKATKWRAKNREEYKKFLNLVIRGENKLIDLVNAQEGDDKIKAFMMYKVLTNFIKEEV